MCTLVSLNLLQVEKPMYPHRPLPALCEGLHCTAALHLACELLLIWHVIPLHLQLILLVGSGLLQAPQWWGQLLHLCCSACHPMLAGEPAPHINLTSHL